MAKSSTKPHTKADLETERLEAVARRLIGSFRELIDAFPDTVGTVADLTRHLDIGRSVCQRITLAVRKGIPPGEALERFPGIRGINQFIDAAENHAIDTRLVAQARAAADEYAALIGAAGGSHRRLVASLRSAPSCRATPNASRLPMNYDQACEQMFEAAATVTGSSCKLRLEINIYRESQQHPDCLDMLSASGLVGVRVADFGVPIARVTRTVSAEGETFDSRVDLDGAGPVLGITPGVVIREFSSNPLPTITARLHNGSLVQIFNPEGRTEHPIDFIIGTAAEAGADNPLRTGPPVLNISNIIGTPAKRFLSVALIERTLALRSIPTTSISRMSMSGLSHVHPDDRWYERLPGRPPLKLLPAGAIGWTTDAYPRIPELIEWMFDGCGWPRERYVGYAVDVLNPIWETEYNLSFEFGDPPRNEIPAPFRH